MLPRSLGHVRGPKGEIEWSEVETEIRPDGLLVDARSHAARTLAATLGSELTEGPEGTEGIGGRGR